MSFSRYRKDPPRRNGKVIGTSEGLVRLRRRMQRGEIAFTTMTLKEGQRLDKLAHDLYGDGRLTVVFMGKGSNPGTKRFIELVETGIGIVGEGRLRVLMDMQKRLRR